MLYSIDGKVVEGIPHRDTYDRCRNNISDKDYGEAKKAILAYIENKDEKVFNSSHIPGPHWDGTAYDPIFRACGESREQSALFFGLIVWEVMVEHELEWYFKPSDKDEEHPRGTTYWLKED